MSSDIVVLMIPQSFKHTGNSTDIWLKEHLREGNAEPDSDEDYELDEEDDDIDSEEEGDEDDDDEEDDEEDDDEEVCCLLELSVLFRGAQPIFSVTGQFQVWELGRNKNPLYFLTTIWPLGIVEMK